MPATRHKFSRCGHKGFGSPGPNTQTGCHRCAQADKLEASLKENDKDYQAKKAEVARLRAPKNARNLTLP
jgi:hypothetical protein